MRVSGEASNTNRTHGVFVCVLVREHRSLKPCICWCYNDIPPAVKRSRASGQALVLASGQLRDRFCQPDPLPESGFSREHPPIREAFAAYPSLHHCRSNIEFRVATKPHWLHSAPAGSRLRLCARPSRLNCTRPRARLPASGQTRKPQDWLAPGTRATVSATAALASSIALFRQQSFDAPPH